MQDIVKHFVPLAFVLTIIFGTVYITQQQSYRQNANDPQIQLAEDAANDLAHDKKPSLPTQTTEISESLAPYLMVFDTNGKPTSSSALLHGKNPPIPTGVFQTAKMQQVARFTWQPEIGVRQAVVLRYVAQKGFVLAGRSLREVENREEALLGYVFFGWITSLLGSLILVSLFSFWKKT